ncbi:MAG: hypothetical protein CME19_23725 [Gemmatimonadetes bacterium]|nr:hypothetical protein [Gemmatimonadota bacterium]|tara:strand:- start:78 stop:554 length:477 start_codon:yes stop_codon:yes gene_type:complete
MLDGILTTALQIIIVLDICGAVLYFLMSGASKAKEPAPETTESSLSSIFQKGSIPIPFGKTATLQPAMAAAGSPAVEPPPVPEWVTEGDRSASQIYGVEGAADVVSERPALSARIGGIVSSIKGKFQRQNTQEIGRSADLNSDRARLNKVLDSFREEI